MLLGFRYTRRSFDMRGSGGDALRTGRLAQRQCGVCWRRRLQAFDRILEKRDALEQSTVTLMQLRISGQSQIAGVQHVGQPNPSVTPARKLTAAVSPISAPTTHRPSGHVVVERRRSITAPAVRASESMTPQLEPASTKSCRRTLLLQAHPQYRKRRPPVTRTACDADGDVDTVSKAARSVEPLAEPRALNRR